MSERVVLLGFDAMDPVITARMAGEDRLPAFKELLRSAASAPVVNPVGLFVGSLWSTFFTGRSAARTGFHCWEEIVPDSYERRLTSAAEIEGTPFWEELSDAGRRVAVIDVPHSAVKDDINGVQISEWGCHDRHFGLRVAPPDMLAEITELHGFHPVLGADPFLAKEWAPDDYVFRAGAHRTDEEEEQLLDGLLAGARAKTALSSQILSREPWDLFVSVFGETHSVGHQSWHIHDARHPRHDPRLRARIGDPLEQVYECMDQALQAHLRQLDQEDALLVLLSHGIGPHYDATHLLPETLRLLNAAYRAERHSSWQRRLIGGAWSQLPPSARDWAAPHLARRLRGRPAGSAHDGECDAQRRAQQFFTSPNNFVVGGVRINLRGREGDGIVEPGAEFDELCERLTADLLALVNVESGSRVVKSVQRTDTHYERSASDRLPDLLLEWNHDEPIETIWSPRFGVIHGTYEHWRTGDHRPGGQLLVRAPGLEGGRTLPPVKIEDLAPSIAARLGVTLEDVDGEPAPYL